MKHHLAELALFGGQPTFQDILHVGRPNIGSRERLLQRINGALDRRWLTNQGPLVQEFEQQVSNIVGVKHCIAMCNATVALEIAIRAFGLSGEVIVPSMTFIATAHALQWQHVTPVFCDIDPDTLCLDPAMVEPLITPRTTGIIGVHLFGKPCHVEALEAIASRHGLTMLFDAAHAFGCSKGTRAIGTFGNAEVLSFHATKFLNALEGGAVVTDDDDAAERIRRMKNFGFAYYDEVTSLGTNGKMTEFSAAMGLTSLESMTEFIEVNRRNYRAYREQLDGVPGIALAPYDDAQGRSNYQYVVLQIDADVAGVSRDDVLAVLHAENILARRYFYPGCHKAEPYRSQPRYARLHLPVTERVSERILQLPTGSTVTTEQIETIGQLVRFCVDHAAALREKRREGQ